MYIHEPTGTAHMHMIVPTLAAVFIDCHSFQLLPISYIFLRKYGGLSFQRSFFGDRWDIPPIDHDACSLWIDAYACH